MRPRKVLRDRNPRKMVLVDYNSDVDTEDAARVVEDNAINFSSSESVLRQLNNKMIKILFNPALTEEEKIFHHRNLLRKFMQVRSEMLENGGNSLYTQKKYFTPFSTTARAAAVPLQKMKLGTARHTHQIKPKRLDFSFIKKESDDDDNDDVNDGDLEEEEVLKVDELVHSRPLQVPQGSGSHENKHSSKSKSKSSERKRKEREKKGKKKKKKISDIESEPRRSSRRGENKQWLEIK